MKTIFIGKIWPEPTSSAAGTRVVDILRALKTAGWDTTFACAAQPSDRSLDIESTLGARVARIELNSSSFDRWIAQQSPQIVLFDRFMTEEQFGWRVENACPHALRVLDTSDLHCLREARHQSLRTGKPVDLHNEIALREIASIHRCDLTLVISEYELQLARDAFAIPDSQLAYWPFVIDPPIPGAPAFDDRKHCAMIGSFLHEPNWDAVRWCREAIWPLIRAELPDVDCHVYGSYPPPKALQLDSPAAGFRVLGAVDDAVATLARYRLNLAPLRFGAGLKGKLADGFRAGTPGIVTPVAAEGMPGELPWGSRVCPEPDAFAQEAVALYRDPTRWRSAQAAGYDIAAQRFAPERWLPELPRLLASANENAPENRRRNFVGRMLRHHLHRSTEFMSRWIEAKSRNAPNEPPPRT